MGQVSLLKNGLDLDGPGKPSRRMDFIQIGQVSLLKNGLDLDGPGKLKNF